MNEILSYLSKYLPKYPSKEHYIHLVINYLFGRVHIGDNFMILFPELEKPDKTTGKEKNLN